MAEEGGATRFWWIRHAPVPYAAAQGRIYGASDVACDITDAAPAQGLARRLPGGARWYTSDLQRTHQTAAAIRAAAGGGPEATGVPALKEQHLGAWQGQTHAELNTREPEAVAAFWADPGNARPPHGESFADLLARVGPAIGELAARHPGAELVIVAHGGTIRAAAAVALGLDPAAALRLVIDNWSLTVLTHCANPRGQPGPGWRVEGINLDPR